MESLCRAFFGDKNGNLILSPVSPASTGSGPVPGHAKVRVRCPAWPDKNFGSGTCLITARGGAQRGSPTTTQEAVYSISSNQGPRKKLIHMDKTTQALNIKSNSLITTRQTHIRRIRAVNSDRKAPRRLGDCSTMYGQSSSQPRKQH